MRGARALFASLVALVAGGCDRAPTSVAELSASPAEVTLPFPAFAKVDFEITPRIAMAPGVVPQLFLHLLDESGALVRTFDLPVTQEWEVGRAIPLSTRLYQSALSDPLESGSYVLTAGLYERGGERFALTTDAEEVARQEYAVAKVTVPDAAGSLPAVRFSNGFLPAAPGQDRQVLVRRSVDGAGPATLQIGPLTGPGRLLLRLAPAPSGAAGAEVQAGADSPRVRVRSSCGGVEAELSGDVLVETLLDVPASPTGPDATGELTCDVELAPNFTVRSPADESKLRSISLEVLAWRAGGSGE